MTHPTPDAARSPDAAAFRAARALVEALFGPGAHRVHSPGFQWTTWELPRVSLRLHEDGEGVWMMAIRRGPLSEAPGGAAWVLRGAPIPGAARLDLFEAVRAAARWMAARRREGAAP